MARGGEWEYKISFVNNSGEVVWNEIHYLYKEQVSRRAAFIKKVVSPEHIKVMIYRRPYMTKEDWLLIARFGENGPNWEVCDSNTQKYVSMEVK